MQLVSSYFFSKIEDHQWNGETGYINLPTADFMIISLPNIIKNLEKLSFQLSFESALAVVISVDFQNPIT